MSVYYTSGMVLRALHMHLSIFLYYTDEESEALGSKVMCPGPQ